MMCHRIGRPPISTSGFGRVSVSSARRVPYPPARMTTFTEAGSYRIGSLPLAAMVSVCVLMSVYNGERFLREQLDSIDRQEGVEVTVVARDDGSIDGPRDILQQRVARL